MSNPTPHPVRLYYVDDSGAEKSGIASYSWVSVSVEEWRPGLGEILEWREWMRDKHGIPKAYEIHMTKFANGRGNPSAHGEAWNRHKVNRSLVLDETFQRLGNWTWMRAGTIFTRSSQRREGFKDEKTHVYEQLVTIFEKELQQSDEWGFVFMDGDGSDSSYRRAHRNLEIGSRRIIEDPVFQHSHLSQWIQIADIVAYAGYQRILRIPEKKFAWNWWTHLDKNDTLIVEVPPKEAGPVIQRSLGGSAT